MRPTQPDALDAGSFPYPGGSMRHPVVLLMLALASTLTACGGDTTGPGDPYSGEYTLRTVDGQNLPFVIIDMGTATVEVTKAVLTVTDNGTNGGSFTLAPTLRTTDGDQVTTETPAIPGTYTRNGTAAVFTSTADGLIGQGTIGGGRITFSDDLYAYVFQK
jgi:hypothetical protein